MEKRVPARLGAIVLAFAALTVISLALTAPGSFGANEGGGGGGTPPPYPGLTECADAVGVISLGRRIRLPLEIAASNRWRASSHVRPDP